MNIGNDIRITDEGEGLFGVRYAHKYTFHLDPFVSQFHEAAMLQGGEGERVWLLPCLEETIKAAADFFGIDRATLPEKLRAFITPPPKRAPIDLNVIGAYEFLTNPYAHQRGGLAELIHAPQWLLAWEMGTGKTKTVADRLRWGLSWKEFGDRFILILAPRNVRQVWKDGLAEHAALDCTLLEGPGDKRRQVLAALREKPGPHIVVTNYDATRNLQPELARLKAIAVICDEAQVIKNTTSQVHQRVKGLSTYAKYRWALSGTPAPNSPLDILGILSWLKPSVLESTQKTLFEARYAMKTKLSKDPRSAEIVVGYKNLDDLQARVASVSSRMLKDECLDLPPKTFTTRSVEIEGEQLRVYRELEKQAVATLRDQQAAGTLSLKNVLSESLRLLQVLGGFVPDDAGRLFALDPAAKLALLDEVIDEIAGPVLIWACFRPEVEAIAQRLRKRGGRVVEYHGGTKDDERREAVKAFQSGRAQYFVGTQQAGGTGLTLTASSHALYYSRNFSLTDWLQSQDRIHRITQTRPCTITSLLATRDGGKATVDHKVAGSLDRKRDLQNMLLEGGFSEFI